MISRILVASALLLSSAASARAATQLESTKKMASTDISFVGTGCQTRSTRSIVLPETATSVDVIEPDIGTDLFTAGNAEPIATVRSLDSNLKQVTWIASGAGTSCLAENEAARWETAIIHLEVGYTVRERVLTRATVVREGGKICRAAAGKLDPPAGLTGAVTALRRAASALRGMDRRLAALKTPKLKRTIFSRFRRAINRMETSAEAGANAAKAGDKAEFLLQKSEYQRARHAGTSAARLYGFRHTCDL